MSAPRAAATCGVRQQALYARGMQSYRASAHAAFALNAPWEVPPADRTRARHRRRQARKHHVTSARLQLFAAIPQQSLNALRMQSYLANAS